MAEQNINQKYIDEYNKNEADANRQMVFANLVGAIALTVIWILFVVKVFPLHSNTYFAVNILFPVNIVILLAPLFCLKTDFLKKPIFKYFLIFSFIAVISLVNTLLPKHGILAWALCIVMVNHYYNPKFGRIVFIVVLIMMILCLYAGMFFGDYDANIIADGQVNGEIIYEMDESGKYVLPDSPQERYELLHKMLLMGENRYIKVFAFYYSTRAMIISLIFLISNSLNKRTYKLLVNEIRVNTEQQTINTELNVAKEIQLSTLPSEFITNKDVEILAELKAAKEVGGDFYDYFNLDDEHVGIVIGDVSGKGIPAAMFMMKTITCFKNYISASKSPSQILKEVNKTIYEGNANQMFVTCFLAIINTKTGLMRFSNAGHNPPIIGTNSHFRYLKCNSGFILGGMSEAFVVDEEVILQNGEVVTLYTDGITEARNPEKEFYGEDRLINFFNSKEFTSIIHLHHELKDDVAAFVRDADQADDMTFLSIKYHGDEYYYSEKLCDGTRENIPVLLDLIKKFSEENGLPDSLKNNLSVVGDELISNIVKYGYKDYSGDLYLRLLYNKTKGEFVMTIIDKGIPFNQFDVNNSPIEGDVTNRMEGGLGILIVKNIMDKYAYDRVNDKNIITLKKKVDIF